jgi:hypothetical protein
MGYTRHYQLQNTLQSLHTLPLKVPEGHMLIAQSCCYLHLRQQSYRSLLLLVVVVLLLQGHLLLPACLVL